jgi:imidazolonepropionase-like amidohydrolase
MTTAQVFPHHTVVVEDGRISMMGPVDQITVPPGATRINGRDQYLIPGLADMHVHLVNFDMTGSTPRIVADSAAAERRLFLWLANGVTTVRTMDYFEDGGMVLRLRNRVAAGELWSPRIYASSALPRKSGMPIAEVLAAYKAAGYDHIKVRDGDVDKNNIDSLATAAHRLGLSFGGHVHGSVGIERALRSGYRSIEHLHEYLLYLMDGEKARRQYSQESDSAYWAAWQQQLNLSKIPVLVAMTKRGGVWNAPTQALAEVLAQDVNVDTLNQWPEMRYASTALRDFWLRSWKGSSMSGAPVTPGLGGTLDARRRLIKTLQDSGAGLLLDSDAPVSFMVPGFSTHRALEALVRSGLTPYEALATGTRNVATFYGAGYESGTIAAGKRADLVLLQENPLIDIRGTTRSSGVMIGGRWLSRAEIDRRLAELVGTI